MKRSAFAQKIEYQIYRPQTARRSLARRMRTDQEGSEGRRDDTVSAGDWNDVGVRNGEEEKKEEKD